MVGWDMDNELIKQLSKLETERMALKRNINSNYYNKAIRKSLFFRLCEVNEEIKKVKFKLRLEEKKDENIGN